MTHVSKKGFFCRTCAVVGKHVFLQMMLGLTFLSSFFPSVPADLSPEERAELEEIRRRKGALLLEIQRLREELREAMMEVEGLENSTEGRSERERERDTPCIPESRNEKNVTLTNAYYPKRLSVAKRFRRVGTWQWGGRNSTWTPKRWGGSNNLYSATGWSPVYLLRANDSGSAVWASDITHQLLREKNITTKKLAPVYI